MSPSMKMSVDISTQVTGFLFKRRSKENSGYTQGLRGGEKARGRKEGRAAQTTKGSHQGQRDTQVPNPPRGISVFMCRFKAWATLSH